MTDFAALDALVEQGYLTKSELDDLVLYNYTDNCSFERFWPTECLTNRGTIYRKSTGQIVARPYDKFFNINEREETKLANLPDEPFTSAVKEDGSMGVLFEHKGAWRVSTRGSFYSDQAVEATEMLNEHITESIDIDPDTSDSVDIYRYDMKKWPAGWTPIVEIIYPENRLGSGLVVNYGDQRMLILTGARHIRTGTLMSPGRLDVVALEVNFARPECPHIRGKSEDLEALLVIAETMDAQQEGWVITYPTSGLMLKIKGKKYMELARFMGHVNPISIWEQMCAGTIRDFLKSTPEEVRDDAVAMRDKLGGQLNTLLRATFQEIERLKLLDTEDDKQSRKAMAERIFAESPKWMQSSLLSIMRSGEGVSALMKMIRPKGGKYVDLAQYGVQP